MEVFTRKLINSRAKKFSGIYIVSVDQCIQLHDTCKIAVLRIDKFGDTLISIPTLRNLRERFPHARIDVIIGKANKGLSQQLSHYVNSVFFYDKTLIGLIRTILFLRKNHYDVCLDPMDNPSITSGNLCLLSGATHTIGICKQNAHKYSHCVKGKDRSTIHIVERTAQLLIAFGIDPNKANLDCEFTLSDSCKHDSLQKLSTVIDPNKPVIAINIAGSTLSRTMNPDFAINVYQTLTKATSHLDLQFVFFGPESHKTTLDLIRNSVHCIIAPFTQSFDEYAAMLKSSSIIISTDTSAVHLASCWKRPTLCLFCKDHTGTALWTPYNTLHESIQSTTFNVNDIDVSSIGKSFSALVETSPLKSAFEQLYS